MTKINKIENGRVDEISIVPRGKNGKRVAFMKEDKASDILAILAADADGDAELAKQLVEDLDENAALLGTALYRLVKSADNVEFLPAVFAALEKGHEAYAGASLNLWGDDALEGFRKLLSIMKKREVEKEAVVAALEEQGYMDEKDKVVEDNAVDTISKEEAAMLSKENEDLRKELATLAADLRKEQKARRDAVLSKEADELCGANAELGLKILKGFEPGVSSEDRTAAREAFVALSKSVSEKAAELEKQLVTENGDAGSDTSDNVFDEITQRVEGMLKEDAQLSKEDALAAVFQKDNDLYKRYRKHDRVLGVGSTR